MTASGRTPVGGPSSDPIRDSELGLPRTYGRTDGDGLVKTEISPTFRNAREPQKPRLLDLFCGAGGCSVGYSRAGFDVVGVDNEDHPDYPFPLTVADAMAVLEDVDYLRTFDAIHASPPCKAFTKTGWAYKFDYHSDHEDLLTPTRERLQAAGVPWVIENVPGSPMRPDLLLCGSQFGLGVRRHRWFELSWTQYSLTPPCDHSRRVVSPHGNPNRFKGSAAQWAVAMEIDWMKTEDLSQAIPPAYTEYVGALLLAQLEEAAA